MKYLLLLVLALFSCNAPKVKEQKKITSNDTLTFFGDSITSGYGMDSNLRYSTLLCEIMNCHEDNRAVPGTVLMKREPVNPWFGTGPNMVDNMNTIPYKTVHRKKLFIAYGYNDIRWNSPNYTPVNFRQDYTAIIDHAKGKGWRGKDVILITPYYKPHKKEETDNPPVTFERYVSFVNTIKSLGNEHGFIVVDAFNFLRLTGGSEYMQKDKTHLNEYAHKQLAGLIYSQM